jgi:tRNA 2-thiouridine synthesizing protein E
MAFDFNGQSIETTDNGYLVNQEDWSEELAAALAKAENIEELTEKHWDIINYLRDEYFNNGGNQPNERTIMKAMGDKWGGRIGQKDTFSLFPGMPSKQAGLIAGLPETRRKGGY